MNLEFRPPALVELAVDKEMLFIAALVLSLIS